jgi:CheY-like chemotaxis protein
MFSKKYAIKTAAVFLKGKARYQWDIQMFKKMDMKQREIRLLSYGFQIQYGLNSWIMIDEKEKFESGMNDYLSKPITVSDLEKY